jgi:hypothetical protein
MTENGRLGVDGKGAWKSDHAVVMLVAVAAGVRGALFQDAPLRVKIVKCAFQTGQLSLSASR